MPYALGETAVLKYRSGRDLQRAMPRLFSYATIRRRDHIGRSVLRFVQRRRPSMVQAIFNQTVGEPLDARLKLAFQLRLDFGFIGDRHVEFLRGE